MIYTIEKANMVAEQLRRFTSGYAHHVVGLLDDEELEQKCDFIGTSIDPKDLGK